MKTFNASVQNPACANDYGMTANTIGLRFLDGKKWKPVVKSTIVEHYKSGHVSNVTYLDNGGDALLSLNWLSLVENPSAQHPDKPGYVPLLGDVVHYDHTGQEISRTRALFWRGIEED